MPEQNDSDKSCDQLDEMYHGIQGIILQLISNGALRGTRLARGRRPEVNRCSELRILELSVNRAGRNELIKFVDLIFECKFM